MKTWLSLPLLVLLLAGCAGKTAYRDSCAAELNAAWKEQSLAEAEGFAGGYIDIDTIHRGERIKAFGEPAGVNDGRHGHDPGDASGRTRRPKAGRA